ncbi:(2S)-methylsuccinyl-CoA dehydrogenase [Ferrithrix thermotolerans DSM 19514]|uniref:(2S)-methylsuccinyl-CoA dehydrogenase n=2 Tax=Ferrithrix TaxID=643949 RepID=A0A1M4VTJ5_9ACTN|nr:(2S)-methylsuccinyl-CoA dehydrogenase [Ferrithrix thermotolerans DSM 19514]
MEMEKSELSELEDVVSSCNYHIERVLTRCRQAAVDPEYDQVLAYELAHTAASVQASNSALNYARRGSTQLKLAQVFVADVVDTIISGAVKHEHIFDLPSNEYEYMVAFRRRYGNPNFTSQLAETQGDRGLDAEFELLQDTFRRFAEQKLFPVADEIHRRNLDIPEEIISELGEMGAFGLSIPEAYGGFATGGGNDYLAMVVATEELSRGSLGAGGSLITRPEILTRALLRGGTEEQKQRWLPKLASGEIMNAVAVTEPDYGSDVANIKTTATRDGEGWLINGVKTWCTFAGRADVLMLLARTDPDRTKAHRGLSLFIIEKERFPGHAFRFTKPHPTRADLIGKIEGRAIDTLGYRGMHSYELSIENWWVPNDSLVGGEQGLGKGFYFQMEGFENGRIQTAARAIGVMQAAYEQALRYASDRKVFGKSVSEYQLTKVKLAKMAAHIQAARQFAYDVSTLMAKGEGVLEASMIKAHVCNTAEWITREAMQIHGGMGYAEEYSVSRLFVDARVLSIFEGADETLSLKVIAKRLLDPK